MYGECSGLHAYEAIMGGSAILPKRWGIAQPPSHRIVRGWFTLRIPWELIASFAVGLGLICLTGYLLLVPMKLLWRLVAGGVLGALALGLINLVGMVFGFSISVNPFTAMAVGFLGLPGVVLLVILQLLM